MAADFEDVPRPITPVPAATVILLRDSAGGFEVFMARRHIKSDFAPDVYVFPGGKADPGDSVDGEHLRLPDLPRLESRGGPDVGWRAIYMAAIRELFEESGLALGITPDGAWPSASPEAEKRWRDYRDRVRSGSLSMVNLAAQTGVIFAADRLCLFSNWITPEVLTKRFDTFFFLARLPEGLEARLADTVELTDSVWITPNSALERFAGGDFPLVFATERNLEALARFDSIDALWNATIDATIHPISPRWLDQNGERVFLIPGDTGYETAVSR